MDLDAFELVPIGLVRSGLTSPEEAPKQSFEGGVEAHLEIDPRFTDALEGVVKGQEIILLTWLHQSDREVLKVHTRGDPEIPLAGVFATRSPALPNPIGLHRTTVIQVDGLTLKVHPIEAIDGTPVIDIKPVLKQSADF